MVGFDPALHSQETRGRFCAQHGAAKAPSADGPTETGVLAAGELPVVGGGGVAHLILIGVHAHNRFTGPAAMERIRALYGNPPTALISLPCCHQFNPQNDLGERA